MINTLSPTQNFLHYPVDINLLLHLGILLLLTENLKVVVKQFPKVRDVFIAWFHIWLLDLFRSQLPQDMHGSPLEQLELGETCWLLRHLHVSKEERIDATMPLLGLLTTETAKSRLEGSIKSLHQAIAHRIVG
ncbi:hypothetical protein PoB_003867400 [Plakobranchus ocellatus]|uniref:Uncharacterized protein n=1 Tax=Plakobranchus ocellatus TaxID=259542 RepID=A0AAV4AWJ7_9GAST|nr:hypothetical protein PoB_003867400 [Plakobranchus ocellatus]